VLAVGDAAFQRKCFDEFARMRGAGRTILLVTHDMSTVERFCDRAMLLERGTVMSIGAPDEVAQLYNEVNFGRLDDDGAPAGDPDQSVRIGRVWCEDELGDRLEVAAYRQTCRACMEVEFRRPVAFPIFTMTFRNDMRHTIFRATSVPHEPPGQFKTGERATVRFTFENILGPSQYTLTPAVGEWVDGYRLLAQRDDVAALVVESTVQSGGVADLPTELEVVRE
jgi:ABC-2 type transport system ATP-binding protein